VNRYRLRVPADDAEVALARMLELFPAGVEEERDGPDVVLAGYADEPPAPDLEPEAVTPGWEDAWRTFHRPVRVGRLWIGPPWFESEEIAVVIDPGRAFGTGAHGSTRAALELLGRLESSAALDLGCGSGVLSIAASRLGFGPLQAFDVDPLAVGATAENAARNGVEVAVARADVLDGRVGAQPDDHRQQDRDPEPQRDFPHGSHCTAGRLPDARGLTPRPARFPSAGRRPRSESVPSSQ
jgi:ribosomal protein L11 methyltransferase